MTSTTLSFLTIKSSRLHHPVFPQHILFTLVQSETHFIFLSTHTASEEISGEVPGSWALCLLSLLVIPLRMFQRNISFLKNDFHHDAPLEIWMILWTVPRQVTVGADSVIRFLSPPFLRLFVDVG